MGYPLIGLMITTLTSYHSHPVSAPILALRDFSQPFDVETDASRIAVGGVLSQRGHPIAFFSKKMSLRWQVQSGKTNRVADALSRVNFDPPQFLMSLSSPMPALLDDFRKF